MSLVVRAAPLSLRRFAEKGASGSDTITFVPLPADNLTRSPESSLREECKFGGQLLTSACSKRRSTCRGTSPPPPFRCRFLSFVLRFYVVLNCFIVGATSGFKNILKTPTEVFDTWGLLLATNCFAGQLFVTKKKRYGNAAPRHAHIFFCLI